MSRRLIIVVLAAGAVLFVLLALLAHFNAPLPGDETLAAWLQNWQSPFVDVLMRIASFLGDTWPATFTVAFFVLILFFRGHRLGALFVAALPALAALFNYLIKNLVDRPRPGADVAGGGLSFPSGHTTYAVVFFGLVALLAPRFIRTQMLAHLTQAVLVLLIVAIGVSRIYLVSHWPSDVLGSFTFGGLMLLAAATLYDNLASKEGSVAGAA